MKKKQFFNCLPYIFYLFSVLGMVVALLGYRNAGYCWYVLIPYITGTAIQYGGQMQKDYKLVIAPVVLTLTVVVVMIAKILRHCIS